MTRPESDAVNTHGPDREVDFRSDRTHDNGVYLIFSNKPSLEVSVPRSAQLLLPVRLRHHDLVSQGEDFRLKIGPILELNAR
jgi:hypothetical protein